MITKNATRFQSKNTCLKTIHVSSVIYGHSSWLCTQDFLKEFSHLFWYFWFRKYSVFRRKLFLFSSFSSPPSFLVNILSFFLLSPPLVVYTFASSWHLTLCSLALRSFVTKFRSTNVEPLSKPVPFLKHGIMSPRHCVSTLRLDLSSLCFCADSAELNLHLFQEALSFLPTSPQLL